MFKRMPSPFGQGYRFDENDNRVTIPKRYMTGPRLQTHAQVLDTFDYETDNLRAVGKISTHPLTDAKVLEMYREYERLYLFEHPTLETIYNFYIDPYQQGLMYITDESSYLEPTLRSKIEKMNQSANRFTVSIRIPNSENNFPTQSNWSLTQIQSVARQLVSLLNYLHEQSPPVIHDNLFPDRLIVLSDEPRISTRLYPPMCLQPLYTSITKDWMDKNPSVFAAPERWSETMEYDCGVDIWNLGMCLMEMIFGFEQLKKLDHRSIVQLVHLVSFKPLECFLEGCLCQDRFARSTAEELARQPFINNDILPLIAPPRIVQTEDECYESEDRRIRQYHVVLQHFSRTCGLPVGAAIDVLNLIEQMMTYIPFSEPAFDVTINRVHQIVDNEFSISLSLNPRPQYVVITGPDTRKNTTINFTMKEEENAGDITAELITSLHLRKREHKSIEEALSWKSLRAALTG